jgi:NAD(P)-dependent dehydrogenase (short-subunit alcohol dehydrogenase family)
MTYLAPFDLTGKTALITGVGSGFGVEFAEICAEACADVACADVNGDTAAKTAARVKDGASDDPEFVKSRDCVHANGPCRRSQ